MQTETLEIYNETQGNQVPVGKNIPIQDWDFLYEKFKEIKDKILGNPKNAQRINKKQRNKNYIPNTLSFKYSDNSGEIILTPEIILKEKYEVGSTTPLSLGEGLGERVMYLFIHSCLHLTNLDHGTKMDELEKKYIKAFVI